VVGGPLLLELSDEEVARGCVVLIHQTYGFYANGSWKCNGVDPKDLDSHIMYNLKMRPGRAFFVDGECLNMGYLDEPEIAKALEIIKAQKPIDRCTAPYV
jgi:hypothetical protein